MTTAQKKRRHASLCRLLFSATEERDAHKRALRRATGKRLCAELQAKVDEYAGEATRITAAIATLTEEIEGVTA